MERVLVSACLVGADVRYNGVNKRSGDAVLARWQAEGRVVAVCPEVAGGLPVPRPPAEMVAGAGGHRVLGGQARVLAATGKDVTAEFIHGARQALEVARRDGIGVAVLKEGSPSCGSSYVYDGSFSGVRVPGQGVTAALLEAAGIRVFSEAQFLDAEAELQRRETAAAGG